MEFTDRKLLQIIEAKASYLHILEDERRAQKLGDEERAKEREMMHLQTEKRLNEIEQRLCEIEQRAEDRHATLLAAVQQALTPPASVSSPWCDRDGNWASSCGVHNDPRRGGGGGATPGSAKWRVPRDPGKHRERDRNRAPGLGHTPDSATRGAARGRVGRPPRAPAIIFWGRKRHKYVIRKTTKKRFQEAVGNQVRGASLFPLVP